MEPFPEQSSGLEQLITVLESIMVIALWEIREADQSLIDLSDDNRQKVNVRAGSGPFSKQNQTDFLISGETS